MVPPAMDSNLAHVLPHDLPPRGDAPPSTLGQVSTPSRERHLGPARVVEERRLSALSAALRICFAVCVYAVCAPIVLAALLVCLPSRKARIKIGNLAGQVTGGLAVWLTGSAYHVRGVEHLDPMRPAIYVANHASMLDIAVGLWIAPVGTCGVAKKEIVRYPFFGQYYWLSGHLLIDRKNARAALKSLNVLCSLVKKHALSVFIWPEGHRAPDGRLRSFKRGAFRLALETKLPIVPVVIAGSHRAWPANAIRLTRTNVDVTCLPAIDTSEWTSATLGAHVRDIEALFTATLPTEQRPLPTA